MTNDFSYDKSIPLSDSSSGPTPLIYKFLFENARHYSLFYLLVSHFMKNTVNRNSLLSGCGLPSPPVVLHGPVGLVSASLYGILIPVGGQNQPLTIDGCRSVRLHPLKLHFRPEVQVNRCASSISFCFKNSVSSGVSVVQNLLEVAKNCDSI